jgi:excisionase family DNA binding protein
MISIMHKVMTLEEVAEFIKVHPSTVYRLLRKHQIPAFRLGSDWRFNLESIERWIAEREAANTYSRGKSPDEVRSTYWRWGE